MSLRSEYSERTPVLKNVADDIENLVREILNGVPRVDRISSRVKSVERFLEKTEGKGYHQPLQDIQDQIGVRIVVFYRSDIQTVSERVIREFREVENRPMEQPDPEVFSYEARHVVCLIPPDIHSRHKPPIDFFELQISTLFQHAWAEANHDLGYKPHGALTYEFRKKIAWAAAQTWGADVIFDELWNQSNPQPG